LFWDGDTTAAAADVRALSAMPHALTDPVHVRAACRLGLWSLARGDRAGVQSWSGRLRAARRLPMQPVFYDDDRVVCAELLDAWLALRDNPSEAGRLLRQADSIYVDSDVFSDWPVTNLVTARLRDALGDLAGARRAAGRILVELPLTPVYHTTYLREQARLELQAGDTASAVRALRRYVALRGSCEPGLRPELDRARAQLAALVGR
jgi:hypothetical protein